MASTSKKRRIDQVPPRTKESAQSRGDASSPTVKTDNVPLHNLAPPSIPTSGNYLKVQQAKKNAVAQAQQEGCIGNFKSFDSLFGNFLLPTIPTCAELTR